MGKIFDEISTEMREWISAQKLFFVSTAPLDATGKSTVHPRVGMPSGCWVPMKWPMPIRPGGGIETVAHLRENGRIVIIFCAFEGGPKIVRLHGQGDVIEPGEPDFAGLQSRFPKLIGVRAFIRVRVTRIADSCGFAVPLYAFVAPRDVLDRHCEKLGPEGLAEYRVKKNRASID